jgi:hypothetical protein
MRVLCFLFFIWRELIIPFPIQLATDLLLSKVASKYGKETIFAKAF